MEQGRRLTSRERMVLSAAALVRERGYTGTSFADVIEHSGAPRGSIYHHFPGGKTQLMTEAVELVAGIVDDLIADAGPDPEAALQRFVDAWEAQLEASGFRAGCPVVGIAVELPDGAGPLADATAQAFERWGERFAAVLAGAGLPRAQARRLATLVVAAVEGAVVLSRARRDTGPLQDVGRELRALVHERVAAR